MSKQEDVPKFEDTDPVSDETTPSFEDTTPHEDSQSLGTTLYNKAADFGNSAVNGLKNIAVSTVNGLADTGHGIAQGLSLGGSDEAIALAKATSEAKFGSPDWVKSYRKYQALEQEKNKAAQERSPWLYKAGELGGMIIPAVATAGAALPEEAAVLGAETAGKLGAKEIAKYAGKSALTGAGIGATQGFLGSEDGHLIGGTPEEKQALAADTLGGTATGAVLGGALGAGGKLLQGNGSAIAGRLKAGAVLGAGGAALGASAGAVTPGLHATSGAIAGGLGGAALGLGIGSSKVSQFMEESPFWRRAKEGELFGENGISTTNEKTIQGPIGETTGLINNSTNASQDLMDRIYTVKQQLGKNIGTVLDNASDQGITVNATEPMLNSVDKFKNLLENDQTLLANPKAQKLYDTIFKLGDFDAENLSPKTVQSLRSDVIDFSNSISESDPNVAALGNDFQQQLRQVLSDSVPGYDAAANRYYEFNRLVPRTLISGPVPVGITESTTGDLSYNPSKLFKSIRNMIENAGTDGQSSNSAKLTYKNFINGLNEFEQNDAKRVAEGLVPKDEQLPKLVDTSDPAQANAMYKHIQKLSDQSAMLKNVWGIRPDEKVGNSATSSIFGKLSVANLANKYGLYKSTIEKPVTAPINLVKNLYGAGESQLKDIGTTMSNIPGIAPLGKSLVNGLENKDTMSINAAIFSIMQNPQARLFINAQDLKNQKE